MSTFSQILRDWRTARRYSQMELAFETEISARHLSFLETGRANPSREMVLRLGEALQLPLDARNQMLAHAGYAARYKGREWNDAEMEPVKRAVSRQLDQHMPFPGLAVDRLWTIKEANPVASALFGSFGIGIGDSMLDLMCHSALPEVVENWPQVAHHALLRLRTEDAALGGVPEFAPVIRYLSDHAKAPSQPVQPVIPTVLTIGGQRLSMFATISQFGTPEDLLLDDLKVELYHPLDAPTEAVFDQLANAAT